MQNLKFLIFILIILISCDSKKPREIDQVILKSLGEKHKIDFSNLATSFKSEIDKDSTNIAAYLGYADAQVLLYVFGYVPRDITISEAKSAFLAAQNLDSLNTDVLKMSGILSFLDYDWEAARLSLESAIRANPENLNARHWYSLWLTAMGRFDDAMTQSDTIMSMDEAGDYLVGRGSLLYFQQRFEEMKPLMITNTQQYPDVPWGYDWLGMAYNGLAEHEDAIETYFKAFELSDGTVEVGAGLGHALGEAGEIELAKQMADYYSEAAKDNYLPPVQRAFVHLGIGENEEALNLLEQAHAEQSWFLIFMQVEPWLNPLRAEDQFKDILKKMNYPSNE